MRFGLLQRPTVGVWFLESQAKEGRENIEGEGEGRCCLGLIAFGFIIIGFRASSTLASGESADFIFISGASSRKHGGRGTSTVEAWPVPCKFQQMMEGALQQMKQVGAETTTRVKRKGKGPFAIKGIYA